MPNRLPRLGDLEKRLLEWLWSQAWVDVRAAHAAHSGIEGRSLNTIHSTLERLIRKGFVERRRQGRGFAYRAVVSRETFLEEALTDAIEQMPGSDPERMIAAFVDVAERIDEAGLELLERRVADRRRALAQGKEDR